jgi:hypothetical protein
VPLVADERTERPLENPADSQAEIQGQRSDVDTELGPLGERNDPANPPADNAPLGESGGAGMENPGNDRADPSRERFRELRM